MYFQKWFHFRAPWQLNICEEIELDFNNADIIEMIYRKGLILDSEEKDCSKDYLGKWTPNSFKR